MRIITGDIFKVSQGIIVHQVNLQSVMGTGIAKVIKQLYPYVFDRYQHYCRSGLFKLGMVQFIKVSDAPLYICNLAGQQFYGRNRRYTNYAAVSSGLSKLAEVSRQMGLDIYIPYKMGCSNGGGDWEGKILPLIQKYCPNAIIIRLPLKEPPSQVKVDVVMSFKYTGIGSRETPLRILKLMEKLGEKLTSKGAVMRSGGARGADSAFEKGAKTGSGLGEIYLVKGHRGLDHKSQLMPYDQTVWKQAETMAKEHHPCWSALQSKYVQELMIRSTFQVLGLDLKSPSDFVLCWTPDGSRGDKTSHSTGGTGQALRIAHTKGVCIYNLANPADLKIVENWL